MGTNPCSDHVPRGHLGRRNECWPSGRQTNFLPVEPKFRHLSSAGDLDVERSRRVPVHLRGDACLVLSTRAGLVDAEQALGPGGGEPVAALPSEAVDDPFLDRAFEPGACLG